MTTKDPIPADVYLTAERLVAEALAETPEPALNEEARQWIARSDQHRRAFEETAALWNDLGWAASLNEEVLGPRTDAAAEEGKTVVPFPLRPRRRAWMVAGIGAMAAMVAAVLLAPLMLSTPTSQPQMEETPPPETATVVAYETAVGQIREFTLEDGTVVTLGGASAFETRFLANRRNVTFLKGDALFDVAHDTSRPFVVDAGEMDATVVGTTFEVRKSQRRVSVGVLGGKVRVADDEARQTILLTPGEQATMEDGRTLTAGTFDVSTAARWRDTRLSFRAEPLGAIVEEANRYYAPGIRLASPELADIVVTTSFRADQVKTALSGVAAIHELTLEEGPTGALFLSAK